MSVFWKYFRDKLRWPLIFSAGPIALLVKGAAGVLDDVREVVLWLREQFNPDTCDSGFVADHARARGIARQLLETDDDAFRERVVHAYAWWRLGGKTGGLPVVLAYFGYTTEEIVNLRETDPDRWAEFTIALARSDGGGFVEDDYALVEWLVNNQKPARSICAGVDMVVSVSGPTWTYAGIFGAPDVEVWAEAP